MTLLRAERRARQVGCEIRSKGAELLALEDLDLEPGLLLDDPLVRIQVGVMRHAVVLDRILLHADAGDIAA